MLTAVSDAEAALLLVQANAEPLKSADQAVVLTQRSLELTQQVLEFAG